MIVSDFTALEPAIDPNNRISFLLDWEMTMKCNLDCSYCETGTHGGHDNSIPHPELADCIKTIDFMFKYVDLYMNHKPRGIKQVILNVYGGESLHHPEILKILETCKDVYQTEYADNWKLTITTTTNAIISDKKLAKIIPFIDEFTVSYHSENTLKQKEQFKKNLLSIRESGKRLKCVILMHADPDLFEDSNKFEKWCDQNQIRTLPRQLDHPQSKTEFNYNEQQVKWFDNLYKKKSWKINDIGNNVAKRVDDKFDLADSGRACCGGRSLCADANYKSRNFFVDNKFPDWYCSVNEFFLFVKQVNGEIYVNKDCKMSFQGQVAPIGNLSDTSSLLDWTRGNLEQNTMPIIQCKKYRCYCGLCAPKAKDLDTFITIMRKFRK